MKPSTAHPGAPLLLSTAALALLAGCAGRGPAPADSTQAGPRVEPATPLYEKVLEHEGWNLRVEVPASEDWASGSWRLRVWHSFLLTVPREVTAERPATPAGAWLTQMDGDPEPELALWSRPADGRQPGTLQLWDLMSGNLYPRPVPAFALPGDTAATGELVSWDGKHFVREFHAGPRTTRHRWAPGDEGWRPFPE